MSGGEYSPAGRYMHGHVLGTRCEICEPRPKTYTAEQVQNLAERSVIAAHGFVAWNEGQLDKFFSHFKDELRKKLAAGALERPEE